MSTAGGSGVRTRESRTETGRPRGADVLRKARMTTTNDGRIGVVDATDDRFARLKRHVEYAYSNTEYYRSAFDRHGLQPGSLSSWDSLRRFPFITKEDVIANQEAHRPLGTLVAASAKPLRRIYCTAGSLYFAYTDHDVQHSVENDARQKSEYDT